jgi:hypothetical protein
MRLVEKTISKIPKYSRTIFILLSWILLLGIIIQVSFVGLAITFRGVIWQNHRELVKIIEYIPVFMFIFGCAGGIPKYYRAWSFLLFFFINFQYYTTYSWLSAIHAAFALFIFMISLHVAWGAYKIFVNDKKKHHDLSESNNFGTEMGGRDSSDVSINGNSKINEAG